MGNELLVRCYNVGCGDCIYVRIPNGDDTFNILIDCGTKESASTGILQRSIKDMADNMLPTVPGQTRKRLDLLIVTHGHEDHIKGFDPAYFSNIQINDIWITAGMNENHPQAKKSHQLHKLAERAILALQASNTALSPELQGLAALYGVNNSGAIEALTRILPESNGIKPRFVHAGMTSEELGVEIEETMLSILAPEEDIDHFYLGEEAAEVVRHLTAANEPSSEINRNAMEALPTNIGQAEFRILKSRLLSNALAFAAGDTAIQNNVSTVLLIEWKGRRLLFVGDAEWNGEFRKNKRNGSWNVMWHERHEQLAAPVDFLKVGHHGSHNATPWNRHADDSHEVNQILNTILPLPEDGQKPKAQCIVSTKRKQYDTIPDAQLLVELGKRTCSTRNYKQFLKEQDNDFDLATGIYNYSVRKTYSSEPCLREVGDIDWLDNAQPYRTDLESTGRGLADPIDEVEFVDVRIAAD